MFENNCTWISCPFESKGRTDKTAVGKYVPNVTVGHKKDGYLLECCQGD